MSDSTAGFSSDAGSGQSARPARGRVSLFDLRWILAVLFGIYGIVVTLMGLLSHAKTVTASGQNIGVNVNLWTGIPMLVLGILFALWALLRPVVPPEATARSYGPSSGDPDDEDATKVVP
jgi:hypothetical protein